MLRIITTSSLIPRNGVDTLIQACTVLPKSVGWELVIAGDGPEEKYLKKLAKGLPVKFLGRIANSKVPQLLHQSNLFIRPSRFEGFGSSFIEAMAVGLPVIGTPVGGIVDFLFDKRTGFLVRPDDSEALARRIEYLHHHPEIAAKVSSAGQKFVKENFSWNSVAERVYIEMKKICR